MLFQNLHLSGIGVAKNEDKPTEVDRTVSLYPLSFGLFFSKFPTSTPVLFIRETPGESVPLIFFAYFFSFVDFIGVSRGGVSTSVRSQKGDQNRCKARGSVGGSVGV